MENELEANQTPGCLILQIIATAFRKVHCLKIPTLLFFTFKHKLCNKLKNCILRNHAWDNGEGEKKPNNMILWSISGTVSIYASVAGARAGVGGFSKGWRAFTTMLMFGLNSASY